MVCGLAVEDVSLIYGQKRISSKPEANKEPGIIAHTRNLGGCRSMVFWNGYDG